LSAQIRTSIDARHLDRRGQGGQNRVTMTAGKSLVGARSARGRRDCRSVAHSDAAEAGQFHSGMAQVEAGD
jgi:hypothetical protein